MAHLVMDTIIGHEVIVTIRDEDIERRSVEWHKLIDGTLSRSHYIKGLMQFAGIELLDYDSAVVERKLERQLYIVYVRSKAWAVKYAP